MPPEPISFSISKSGKQSDRISGLGGTNRAPEAPLVFSPEACSNSQGGQSPAGASGGNARPHETQSSPGTSFILQRIPWRWWGNCYRRRRVIVETLPSVGSLLPPLPHPNRRFPRSAPVSVPETVCANDGPQPGRPLGSSREFPRFRRVKFRIRSRRGVLSGVRIHRRDSSVHTDPADRSEPRSATRLPSFDPRPRPESDLRNRSSADCRSIATNEVLPPRFSRFSYRRSSD